MDDTWVHPENCRPSLTTSTQITETWSLPGTTTHWKHTGLSGLCSDHQNLWHLEIEVYRKPTQHSICCLIPTTRFNLSCCCCQDPSLWKKTSENIPTSTESMHEEGKDPKTALTCRFPKYNQHGSWERPTPNPLRQRLILIIRRPI